MRPSNKLLRHHSPVITSRNEQEHHRRAAGQLMPSSPANHHAHDYAERVRERLPRRLQELRVAYGLSRYGLERESGISREMIGKVERGTANPSLCVMAQLSCALGMTLSEFAAHLEAG